MSLYSSHSLIVGPVLCTLCCMCFTDTNSLPGSHDNPVKQVSLSSLTDEETEARHAQELALAA